MEWGFFYLEEELTTSLEELSDEELSEEEDDNDSCIDEELELSCSEESPARESKLSAEYKLSW